MTEGKSKKHTNIDEYIPAQDPAIQDRLNYVYSTISAVIPDAEERISWPMPTYWHGCNIIHFSAGKHHIDIYPGPEAVEAFLPKLSGYKTSKGAIQLLNNKVLPLELVKEIALWSYRKNAVCPEPASRAMKKRLWQNDLK